MCYSSCIGSHYIVQVFLIKCPVSSCLLNSPYFQACHFPDRLCMILCIFCFIFTPLMFLSFFLSLCRCTTSSVSLPLPWSFPPLSASAMRSRAPRRTIPSLALLLHFPRAPPPHTPPRLIAPSLGGKGPYSCTTSKCSRLQHPDLLHKIT